MTPSWLGLRSHGHEVIVSLYAVVYLSLLSLGSPGEGALWVVTNTLYFGIGAATIWSYAQAARRDPDRRRRRAWIAIAASCASITLSGAVWTLWVVWFRGEMPAALAMWLDPIYIPFAIAGFLAFPPDPRFTLRDPRMRLDAALFIVGSFALSWHFALRPLLDTSAGFVDPSEALRIAGEWAVAFVASMAFLRAADRATRDAIGLALAGHLVYILTNHFFTAAQASYMPGQWIDAVWFSAWMLRWGGGRLALRAGSAVPAAQVTGDIGRHGLGSSLFVIGAYLLLVLAILLEERGSLLDVAVAATAMTALLLARQRVAMQENRRLALDTAIQAARFRAIVASATDFVLVVGADLRVSYASPSIERVAGSLEGVAFVEVLHPDDRAGMERWLTERAAPSDARAYRCRLRALGDGWTDVEFRVQDRRSDPQVHGLVMNGRDITAERALEAQLGHARKLATLSEMAGRIAHSFNNALAVVQGHAELLADELPSGSVAQEDARAIQAAADRGAGITRQLLGFTGQHAIRPEKVRPIDVINGLLPTLQRLLPPSVCLVVEGTSSQLLVRVDPAQFEQVLVNLVANARDAMPNGGRLLIAVREHQRGGLGASTAGVDRATGRVADELAISVQDDGVGIPMELRTRIFEPFFTTKAAGRGTGLGLAMVQSIIKRAGGRVEVQSQVGHGSTFTITLPFAEDVGAIDGLAPTAKTMALAATVPSPARMIGESTNAAVILLVEDDPLVRRTSRRMIERAGFTVLEAENGTIALEIAARPTETIDLLLTDLMMPGLSGRDVIAGFRVSRPGTPIICVTGFAADREEGSTLADEVNAIVAKPFSSDTLIRALNAALGSAPSGG